VGAGLECCCLLRALLGEQEKQHSTPGLTLEVDWDKTFLPVTPHWCDSAVPHWGLWVLMQTDALRHSYEEKLCSMIYLRCKGSKAVNKEQ